MGFIESDLGPGLGKGQGGMGQRMGPGPRYMPRRFPGRRTGLISPVSSSSRAEEIASLKNKAQWLAQELAEIRRHIDNLEKSKEK